MYINTHVNYALSTWQLKLYLWLYPKGWNWWKEKHVPWHWHWQFTYDWCTLVAEIGSVCECKCMLHFRWKKWFCLCIQMYVLFLRTLSFVVVMKPSKLVCVLRVCEFGPYGQGRQGPKSETCKLLVVWSGTVFPLELLSEIHCYCLKNMTDCKKYSCIR